MASDGACRNNRLACNDGSSTEISPGEVDFAQELYVLIGSPDKILDVVTVNRVTPINGSGLCVELTLQPNTGSLTWHLAELMRSTISWADGAAKPTIVKQQSHSGAAMCVVMLFQELPSTEPLTLTTLRQTLDESWQTECSLPGLCFTSIAQGAHMIGNAYEVHADAGIRPPSRASSSASVSDDEFLAVQLQNQFQLTVLNLSGDMIAELQCIPSDTVMQVKRSLARVCGTAPWEQRLVLDKRVLRDRASLRSCGISSWRATAITCIRVPSSQMSRHLAAQRETSCRSSAANSSLADVVDSALQAEFLQSEKARPMVSKLVSACCPSFRAEIIHWLKQVLATLPVSPGFIHSVVLTMDRYCATLDGHVDQSGFQKCVLGAVCTEMKLAYESEFENPMMWQRVVTYLGHGRLTLSDILKGECEVLSRLGFSVGVPTAATFLRELCFTREEGAFSTVAILLLDLAIFEPSLLYGYPHVVLAAGALKAALRCCGAEDFEHEAIMQELGVYCPELAQAETLLQNCEEDLLELWRCACVPGTTENGSNRLAEFYPFLVEEARRASGSGWLRGNETGEAQLPSAPLPSADWGLQLLRARGKPTDRLQWVQMLKEHTLSLAAQVTPVVR